MYLTYDDITTVHIEHTSKCNLLCPQCARVVDGKVNPNLVLDELKLKDIKEFLLRILHHKLKKFSGVVVTVTVLQATHG